MLWHKHGKVSMKMYIDVVVYQMPFMGKLPVEGKNYTGASKDPKFKETICTGRFVSNLVGTPEDRFSRIAAHLIL